MDQQWNQPGSQPGNQPAPQQQGQQPEQAQYQQQYPQYQQGGQYPPQSPQYAQPQQQYPQQGQWQQGQGQYAQPQQMPPDYGQQQAQWQQQQGQPGMPGFDHSLVTTAFELPGVKVARNFGVVRGIIVRSRSIVGNIGAAFQSMAGGNITLYTELCEQARRDAYEQMIQHAAALGANAVIGVRYDATEISQGITEFLCYGTAVVVAANS